MGAVYEIRRAIVRLECSACGAEANASCDCAKPYVPASAKAAAGIAAKPQLSNVALAKELGISEATVRRARESGSSDDEPESRTGLDGKNYPARKPRTPKEFYATPDDDDDDDNSVTAIWLRIDAARDLAAVPFPGEATQELVRAVRAVAAAWETLAQNLERKL
jgi:hypothetical protein